MPKRGASRLPPSELPSPGIEPGLRPSRGRVRIRHTPRTKCASHQSPARESDPALRLRRPPCARHTRRDLDNSSKKQCPRQELNLIYDLRRVACESVTLQGRATQIDARAGHGVRARLVVRATVGLANRTRIGAAHRPARDRQQHPHERASPLTGSCAHCAHCAIVLPGKILRRASLPALRRDIGEKLPLAGV